MAEKHSPETKGTLTGADLLHKHYNPYAPGNFDSGGFGFGGTNGSAGGFGAGLIACAILDLLEKTLFRLLRCKFPEFAKANLFVLACAAAVLWWGAQSTAAIDRTQAEEEAYEAALEAGHAVVGAYSARIAEEQQKSAPDPRKIEQWRAGRTAVNAATEEIRIKLAALVVELDRQLAGGEGVQ